MIAPIPAVFQVEADFNPFNKSSVNVVFALSFAALRAFLPSLISFLIFSVKAFGVFSGTAFLAFLYASVCLVSS